ncbi:MAG: histidinol-phosphatase HisJ family protein [Anaerolineae bacterium]|nr:histidinol-phosphatase HisJ family protein [Anaerolineae bacterium]
MTTWTDYHVHTQFSCDSDVPMETMCRAALTRGIAEIAFTDHADFEPLDVCSGYFRPERYWEAIRRCRDLFDGQLTIRAGVECGEGHIYGAKIAALLATGDYDVVLGSIHWAQGRSVFDEHLFDGLTLDEGLTLYFDELAGLTTQADYDVIAHFDIIRRATHLRFGMQELDLTRHEQQVRAILRTVARRGKGIEINTSYRRKGIGEPGPSVQILRWFREEGGRIVTLGSDSHAPDHLAGDFERGLAMLREAGFERPTTFERRQPHGG